MRKIDVYVPENIKYMSDWKDYKYPLGHVIVDKEITGCGYTEFCLTNNLNIILCSPRKMLLENKEEQHKTEDNIKYIRNIFDPNLSIDSDEYSDDNIDISKYNTIIKAFQEEVINHVNYCYSHLKPCKILVTYDSLRHIIDALGDNIKNFYIVVDECQSIFMDSSFKSNVELDFVEYLQVCPNVLYLSATPMMEEFLEMIPEFKNLSYYQLIWPNSRKQLITFTRVKSYSLSKEVIKIIDNYKSGNFPKKVVNGNIVESREVVFYVNSVTDILSYIKKAKLDSSECNILCSNTDKNLIRIHRKLGKTFSIGTVPVKGQQHKMFTFCTRTVYIGADFYSTNASTVIISNSNIESLTLDVELDLPQIMGRQRLETNPWKNECTLLYRPQDDTSQVTEEQYMELMNLRAQRTDDVLRNFKTMDSSGKKEHVEIYKLAIRIDHYCRNHVGVSKKTGEAVYNKLVYISQLRAFKMSRIDFQNSIYISKLSNSIQISQEEYLISLIKENIDNFNKGDFRNKLKTYCEFLEDNSYYKNDLIKLISFYLKSDTFENYYKFLGPERIKALGYQESKIQKEFYDHSKEDNLLKTIISNTFKVGNKYLLGDIKNILQQIYNDNNIQKTSKANDIEEWFNIKLIRSTNKLTGKRDKGYEILGIK